MARLLTLLLVLLIIAPALLAREGQMRASERGWCWGIGTGVGCVKMGVKIEWRVLA